MTQVLNTHANVSQEVILNEGGDDEKSGNTKTNMKSSRSKNIFTVNEYQVHPSIVIDNE